MSYHNPRPLSQAKDNCGQERTSTSASVSHRRNEVTTPNCRVTCVDSESASFAVLAAVCTRQSRHCANSTLPAKSTLWLAGAQVPCWGAGLSTSPRILTIAPCRDGRTAWRLTPLRILLDDGLRTGVSTTRCCASSSRWEPPPVSIRRCGRCWRKSWPPCCCASPPYSPWCSTRRRGSRASETTRPSRSYRFFERFVVIFQCHVKRWARIRIYQGAENARLSITLFRNTTCGPAGAALWCAGETPCPSIVCMASPWGVSVYTVCPP